MSEVVLVVDLVASTGRADELIAAFEACIVATHAEPGCRTYALHRDNANPDHFVQVERWDSQADLDAHMAQPYVATLFAAVGADGLLAAAPQMSFTSSLALGDPAKGSL